jgi:hypothetical protein
VRECEENIKRSTFLFRAETANRKTRSGRLCTPRPPLGIYASSAIFLLRTVQQALLSQRIVSAEDVIALPKSGTSKKR